ncbi:hypothetical protein CRE_21320 [Caenorhabditis remanei]|uniref:Uncharacterized protein n=1 Tax=Caenorhabditis remanei TaxID=31234 RepID=E3MUP2_CAERE|nr:hypothetical protein CRE_21320 [Caenorhabditis remanei]
MPFMKYQYNLEQITKFEFHPQTANKYEELLSKVRMDHDALISKKREIIASSNRGTYYSRQHRSIQKLKTIELKSICWNLLKSNITVAVIEQAKDDILYTEEAGCVNNITCRVHFETILAFKLADSEILFPEDNNSDWALLHAGGEEGSSVDLFSSFGIICENNGWYITKYPSGIEYFSKNCNCYPFIGVGGEYDGKKSKLDEFDW